MSPNRSQAILSEMIGEQSRQRIFDEFLKAALPSGEDSEPCTKGDLKNAVNAVVALVSKLS